MKKTLSTPLRAIRIDYHKLYSTPLGSERMIRVLLPPDYFQNHRRRFPVIYMQDGQNLFESSTSQGGRSWKIDATMQKLPKTYQAIVVGVDHGGVQRINEFTPFSRENNHAKGDQYLHFLIQTVKPFIDGLYRSDASPAKTGLAGSSMGGLIALYGGLGYGAVFGKVGAFSPSFWYHSKVFELMQQHQGAKSNFYVIGSKTESRFMEQQLQNTYWSLRKGGFEESKCRVTIRDRGRHNEAFWGREFERMLRFFYG